MKKGFTLVEIMIVVAIVALLAAIAIPNLLRARVNANESSAQATLKTIATGCESYASANEGNYPASIAAMTGSLPPYLNEDYTAAARQGYTFACPAATMTSAGYTCTATPTDCIKAGDPTGTATRTFTITTGAVLTGVACTN